MCASKAMTSSLMMLLIAWMPATHASPTTTEHPDAPASKVYGCAEGYERLLPGEFYACRARYHLQREHYSQMMGTLKEAAFWANKRAQYELGLVYLSGEIPGIPANRPLAIAWLALAAERKDPTYMQMYTAACLHSTPAEIHAGGALYDKMRRQYGDEVAGGRAVHRFNREIKPLDDAAGAGGLVWINGFSPFPEHGVAMLVKIHGIADKYFDGLTGTVTVGALPSKYAHVPPPPPEG